MPIFRDNNSSSRMKVTQMVCGVHFHTGQGPWPWPLWPASLALCRSNWSLTHVRCMTLTKPCRVKAFSSNSVLILNVHIPASLPYTPSRYFARSNPQLKYRLTDLDYIQKLLKEKRNIAGASLYNGKISSPSNTVCAYLIRFSEFA